MGQGNADPSRAAPRAPHVARPSRWRSVTTVASQEVGRLRPMLNGKSLFAAVLVAGLALGAWVIAGPDSVKGDRAVYPVAVEPGSPLLAAVQNDARFRIVPGTADDAATGHIALWLGPTANEVVYATNEPRGRAAAAALQTAVRAQLEREMQAERDQNAAYPVSADLLSDARNTNAPPLPTATSASAAPTPGAPSPTPTPTPDLLDAAPKAAQKQVGVQPTELQPPFPVRSLVLSFAYLIPMNLVAQLCAGTLLADRTRRRAVLLLSAPVPAWTVLAGRVLPYVGLAALVLVGAGIVTTAGAIGWLAAIPIVACVLAAGIVVGLLARNLRELTFLLTGATTTISIFLLLPAMFSAIPAVAALSPVSIVAASIRGEAVGLAMFLTATIPLTLASATLVTLAIVLFREETLFSQRPLVATTVAAIGRSVGSKPLLLLLAGVLTVPFAFGLQLLVLSFAIPVGLTAVIPALLAGLAGVEEGLKLLVLRANAVSVPAGKAAKPLKPWLAATWVGSGFFLGEKMSLLLALTGFGNLTSGPGLLALLGGGGGILLVAPLVLHVVTAMVSGALANRGHAASGWLAATAIHIPYNLAILWALARGSL